jgi:hypothetical protein
MDFKKAYDSVRWEVLYNILIAFGKSMKLITLIKTYLDETYSRFLLRKYLSNAFHIQNGLKKKML